MLRKMIFDAPLTGQIIKAKLKKKKCKNTCIEKNQYFELSCYFRLENAMQLVRLFHQMHPDEPSAEYTASNQLSGFEELWVSLG